MMLQVVLKLILKHLCSPISLQSGQEGSYPIEIFAGSDVNVGTCYVKFTLNLDDSGSKTETQILTLNIQ